MRYPASLFIRLPSKKALPDYYEIIKQPMDFVRIRSKLKSNSYKSFDNFDKDVHLMFSNAREFNREDSEVFLIIYFFS